MNDFPDFADEFSDETTDVEDEFEEETSDVEEVETEETDSESTDSTESSEPSESSTEPPSSSSDDDGSIIDIKSAEGVAKVFSEGGERDSAMKTIPVEQHPTALKIASEFNLQSDDPAWVMIQSLIEQQKMIVAGKYMVEEAVKKAVAVAEKQARVSLEQYAKDAVASSLETINKAIADSLKNIFEASSKVNLTALESVGQMRAETAKQTKILAKATNTNIKAVTEKAKAAIDDANNEESWSDKLVKLLITSTLVAASAGGGAYFGIMYAEQHFAH